MHLLTNAAPFIQWDWPKSRVLDMVPRSVSYISHKARLPAVALVASLETSHLLEGNNFRLDLNQMNQVTYCSVESDLSKTDSVDSGVGRPRCSADNGDATETEGVADLIETFPGVE